MPDSPLRIPRGKPMDIESLKAIADPTRIRIGLLTLDEAKTVKELAAALEVPPTRLYYHVRLLERQGFLRVASRRMVSGIEERRYRAVARKWNVPQKATADGLRTTGLLAALFGAVRAEMEAVLAHEPPAPRTGLAFPLAMVSEIALAPEDTEEFHRLLEALVSDFAPARAGRNARRYRLFIAGYPSPGDSHA